jgi:hypothetical protein
VADAGWLALAVVLADAGAAAGLDGSVRVGAGVASDGVPVAEWVGVPAVALPVVVGDGLVVAGADVGAGGVGVGGVDVGVGVAVGVVVGVVGDGVGVLGVAVGVCDVGVGDGDGRGGEPGSCSGSHDLPLDVVAALAAVLPATTARLAPDAAVSRTLPAISVTVAGRTCAKRIKRPTSAARCCCGTTHPVWSGFTGVIRLLVVAIRHLLDIKRPEGATRSPTRLTAAITAVAVIMPVLGGCRSG